MTKIILSSLGLIIGNILLAKFSFSPGNDTGYLANIGWMTIIVSLFLFSTGIASVVTKKKVSLSDFTLNTLTNNREIYKTFKITFLLFILIAGLHILGYFQFYKYQKERLKDNGICIETIIKDKKWQHIYKSDYGQFVYYTFYFNGKTYNRSEENDSLNIGDTIIVKFLPDNPDNRIIFKKKK
jgi:hypothetical protein